MDINWRDLAEKKVAPPFKPSVDSDQDCHNFDKQLNTETIDDKPLEESLPWNKEIIYDGFTYKGDCLLNASTVDELGG